MVYWLIDLLLTVVGLEALPYRSKAFWTCGAFLLLSGIAVCGAFFVSGLFQTIFGAAAIILFIMAVLSAVSEG